MERHRTTPSYRSPRDPVQEAERVAVLPAGVGQGLMGIGALEEGSFVFFSPEAFVIALDLGRAGQPDP
jgi:hypothetical protein